MSEIDVLKPEETVDTGDTTMIVAFSVTFVIALIGILKYRVKQK